MTEQQAAPAAPIVGWWQGPTGMSAVCLTVDAEKELHAAVAAERERCAKLCDAQERDRDNSRDERYMAGVLAEAIRRGDAP